MLKNFVSALLVLLVGAACFVAGVYAGGGGYVTIDVNVSNPQPDDTEESVTPVPPPLPDLPDGSGAVPLKPEPTLAPPPSRRLFSWPKADPPYPGPEWDKPADPDHELAPPIEDRPWESVLDRIPTGDPYRNFTAEEYNAIEQLDRPEDKILGNG